jgi:hypothetical protein
MKVRVYHVCGPKRRGGSQAEDIVIEIEMPFVPYPGLMIKPTPTSDYLKIAHVFWDIGTPDRILAHTDQEDPLYKFEDMVKQGWVVA